MDYAPEEMVALVDVDLDASRRADDMRTRRKNVAPAGRLCYLAENAGVNFSQILQEGLRAKLHVADR